MWTLSIQRLTFKITKTLKLFTKMLKSAMYTYAAKNALSFPTQINDFYHYLTANIHWLCV